MNLLLLLMAAIGVAASTAVWNSGNGENNFEYLAFLVANNCGPNAALPFLNFEAEVWSGVAM